MHFIADFKSSFPAEQVNIPKGLGFSYFLVILQLRSLDPISQVLLVRVSSTIILQRSCCSAQHTPSSLVYNVIGDEATTATTALEAGYMKFSPSFFEGNCQATAVSNRRPRAKDPVDCSAVPYNTNLRGILRSIRGKQGNFRKIGKNPIKLAAATA